jgi:F420-dependent oxidoreductase-like protein
MIDNNAAAPTKPWFGFHMPSYTYPGIPPEGLFDHVVEQAQLAEELGFRQVTVMDHLYQIGGVGAVDEPMLEAYSVLNALARETKRVRLGTQVTGVTYRNPALLAKMVTTLDLTSGGRAMMGIGAAWNDVEHAAFGYEFPAVRERMDRLDEALTIIRGMFADSRQTFDGGHYRVSDVINMPHPLTPGGPPILVGGGGEQRTLRIAAKHADIVHWFPLGMEALARKSDLLARYCADIGRDVSEIEKSMGAPVIVMTNPQDADAQLARIPPERRAFITVGSAQVAAEALKPYLDAGFTGFTFGNTIYRTPESMRALGETLRLIGG